MAHNPFASRAPSAREALEREHRLTRMPVSTQERDALLARRAQPRQELHLTPNGAVVQTVNQSLDADNERRIGFITKRLEGRTGVSRDDFRRAR